METVGVVKEGDQLKVFWEEANEWFTGRIASFKPGKSHPYHIQYDDGDEEWVAFSSPGVLAALQNDEDVPSAEVLARTYEILHKMKSNERTMQQGSESSLQPPKRKRGRPPGSGKKAKKAGTVTATATRKTRAASQAVAKDETKRQLEQTVLDADLCSQPVSPSKRPRTEQDMPQHTAATTGNSPHSILNPASDSLAVGSSVTAGQPVNPKSQKKGKGLHKKQPATDPPAIPNEKPYTPQQPTSSAGGKPSCNLQQAVGASRAVANASPGKADLAGSSTQPPSPAFEPPPTKPARDPRKTSGAVGSSSRVASPAKQHPPQLESSSKAPGPGTEPVEQASQLAPQPPQPSAKAADPSAVTVFGFQFSTELATVAGVAAEEGDDPPASSAAFPSEQGARGAGHTEEGDVPARGASANGRAEAEGDQAGGEAGSQAAAVPSEEEIQRQVVCRNFERSLVGLTRTKEAIGKATGLALQAAKCNAGPRVVRKVLEQMGAEDSNQQRVNLLYLIDSILQTSVRAREGRSDCGPQSAAGQVYPRVVGAALSQLVEVVARDAQAIEKLEKVLLIWQKKTIISDTLLQPALLLTRTKRAQHDAAWDVAGPLSDALAAPLSGGASALSGSLLPAQARSAGTAAGQPMKEMQTAMAMCGPEGQAALWRMWRRLPMNAVVRLKLLNQKSGSVTVLTPRQHHNEWEDMDALRAEAIARGTLPPSPTKGDVLSSASTSGWEHDSLGESPIPDASPWHWPMLREAKRSAAAAAAQQAQSQRAADAAATAAQAQQWMQLAASSKAQLSAAQQASGEPDEFDQEMLQQIAGAVCAVAQATQQDKWAPVSTLEAEALFGAAAWTVPGTAGGAPAHPPLPFDQPPLPPAEPTLGGQQPPLPYDDNDDDFDDGPPPLPAYSPPQDEYAPAEFGQPPLPAHPPPDDDVALDLLGASPESVQPPLPPSPPKSPLGASPTPLLPPGIGLHRPQQQQLPPPPFAPVPATASRAPLYATIPTHPAHLLTPRGAFIPNNTPQSTRPPSVPPTLPPPAVPQTTLSAVEGALAGLPAGVKGAPPRAVRTWTGFVTQLFPGSHGLVDHPGGDSGCFARSILQGAVLKVGDRVRCRGEEVAAGAQHRWRILSIQKDTGQQAGEAEEEHGGWRGGAPGGGPVANSEERHVFVIPGGVGVQLRMQQQHGEGSSGGQYTVSPWPQGPSPRVAVQGGGLPGVVFMQAAPHSGVGLAAGAQVQPPAAWPAAVMNIASQGGGYAATPAGHPAVQRQQQRQQQQQSQGTPGVGLPPGWG